VIKHGLISDPGMGSDQVSAPLKLKSVENRNSALHRMFLMPTKSQAAAETSHALLVFLQGAGDNSEVCEHLSKQ